MAADDPKAAAAFPSEDHRKSSNLVLLWSLMGNSTLMSIQIENVALKGIIECLNTTATLFFRYTVQLHVAI